MTERKAGHSFEYIKGSIYSFKEYTNIKVFTRFGLKWVGLRSSVTAVFLKKEKDMGLFQASYTFDAHYTFDDGRESKTYQKKADTQFWAFLSNAHLEKRANEHWIQDELP